MPSPRSLVYPLKLFLLTRSPLPHAPLCRISCFVFRASRSADIAYRVRRGMSGDVGGCRRGLAFVPQSPPQTHAFRTNAKPLLTRYAVAPLHFLIAVWRFSVIVWECRTSHGLRRRCWDWWRDNRANTRNHLPLDRQKLNSKVSQWCHHLWRRSIFLWSLCSFSLGSCVRYLSKKLGIIFKNSF
jgi:predicted DCC family thiol-disulfide oxidoreductase YuxK